MDTNTPPVKNEFAIQDTAAWVLRVGIILSILVMLAGLVVVFLHGAPSVAEMKSVSFNDHIGILVSGMLRGDGLSMIEVGILLLVLTPIFRVATSMVLFFLVDRDFFYTLVTFIVLVLTLSALLVVG
jgi:uncharacterized membrane protein